MKIEPTFDFVPEKGNEELYRLEERSADAVRAVCEYRKEVFGEAEWRCALPEAIYNLLDGFERQGVAKAVLHWVDMELHPEKRPRNFGAAKPNEELKHELLKLVS